MAEGLVVLMGQLAVLVGQLVMWEVQAVVQEVMGAAEGSCATGGPPSAIFIYVLHKIDH